VAELRARVLRGLIEAVASHTAAHRTLGLADRPPACLDAVPQLAGCLASEYPDELETATQLIVLVCLTRAGRAAFASHGAALQGLVELLTHESADVRSNVLSTLTSLSADPVGALELGRTSAAQAALDIIECERLERPKAPTAPSDAPSASEMQRAMRMLCNLVRHDAGLRALCVDHPAVADLEAWKSGEAYGGSTTAAQGNAADAVGNAPADDGATQRRSLVASTAGTAGRTNLLGRGGGGGSGDTSAAPTLMGRIVK
jgi:hypothetical protein